MDKRGCIITYPVKGHKENTLKSVIRLGANKVILIDEDESYTDLFDKFGLIYDVEPILTDDMSSIVSSVADLISKTKDDHDDLNVLLLPSDPAITTGMYVAACMEKVKVLRPVSDLEMQCLNLPLFPFVNLNENERFVLEKIIENKEINTRNLFKIIKKEGDYELAVKEKSASRHLQRILNKLEKLKLVTREKRGRYFTWKSSSHSELVFGQVGYEE